MNLRALTLMLVVVAAGCGTVSGKDGGRGGGSGGSGGAGGAGGGGGNVVCSRINCSGCCNGNQCEPGTDALLCGNDGGTCNPCAANQICKTVRACGADPTRNWRIYPLSAQVAPSDNGTAWDSDGSPPDVQLTMHCPASAGGMIGGPETQSYSPGWTDTNGCVMLASQLLGEGFAFSAIDVDVVGSDPITSYTTVVFTEADFVAGQKVLSNSAAAMQSITFRLAAP